METYVVIAQPEEIELVKNKGWLDLPLIITGVGGMNVIRALRYLPKETRILNIGYVGAKGLEIGEWVEIDYVSTYHEKVDFDEPSGQLRVDCLSGNEIVNCYTSTDFVENTTLTDEKCVFDMELAYIRAMFTNVQSTKVVSDKLNYYEYKKNVGD